MISKMLLYILSSVSLAALFFLCLVLPLKRKRPSELPCPKKSSWPNNEHEWLKYFCKNDPLLFIFARVSSSRNRYVLGIALGYIPLFLLSWLQGDLVPKPGVRLPFLTYLSIAPMRFVFIPTCIILALRYYEALPKAADYLSKDNVLDISPRSYTNRHVFTNWRITVAILLPIAVIVAIHRIKWLSSIQPTSPIFVSWMLHEGHPTYAQWCVDFLKVYLYLSLGLFVHKLFYNVKSLKQVLEEKTLNMRMRHPDGCGGCAPFGHICMASNWLVFVSGVAITQILLFRVYIDKLPFFGYYNMVPLGLYTVGAPLIFLWPVWSVHGRMKARKNDLLNELSLTLDYEYKLMKSEVLDSREEVIVTSSQRLEHVQKLYDMAETLPTWPFNNRMLRIFTGTWLSPILIALLAKLAEALIKKGIWGI